jgi:hypothetical protein
MPRHPLGDKAMTDAERQRRRRDRLREEKLRQSFFQPKPMTHAELEKTNRGLLKEISRLWSGEMGQELERARMEISTLNRQLGQLRRHRAAS